MIFEKPYIELTITTSDTGNIVLINEDYGGDIIQFNFSKSISEPAGNFSFSIPEKRYTEKNSKKYIDFRLALRAMSLVSVKINGIFTTIGFITSVNKSYDRANNGLTIWNISGVELGNIFQKTKIWYDLSETARNNFDPKVGQVLKMDMKTMLDKSIQNVIKSIYDQWFKVVYDNIGFSFSDSSELSDKLIVDKSYMSTDLYVNEIVCLWQSWNYEGDLWGAFSAFVSQPIHELFCTAGGRTIDLLEGVKVDLEEDKFYLILRPTPYDDIAYLDIPPSQVKLQLSTLERIIISDDNIIAKTLGVTSSDMFSYYQMLYGGSAIPENFQKHLYPPIYDKPALKKYGYNPMVKKLNAVNVSNMPSTAKAYKGNLRELLSDLQEKMYLWYKNNDRFLRGNFTVNLDPNIREGMCLRYERTDKDIIEDVNELGNYYIQGFSHNYMYGAQCVTNIEVIRGTPETNGWFDD